MNNKLKNLEELKNLYNNNENIMEYLRGDSKKNNIDDIILSYELQAGSYLKGYEQNKEFYAAYTKKIFDELFKLGKVSSIMEVGVGEGTVLSDLYKYYDFSKYMFIDFYGFDISLSRLFYANKKKSVIKYFNADLLNIPMSDNSIDIVYTHHSIEPNSEMEHQALKELYRVTRKYLVLLEPAYELTKNEEAKKRMERMGYIQNLYQNAKDFDIIKYEIFADHRELNPTSIMIIKKNSEAIGCPKFICPVTKKPLNTHNKNYYYTDDGIVYPIINEVPCLLERNKIVALKIKEFL